MDALAMLAISGLTKRYPGVVALHNVSLAVKAGEVLALVGENGAGKSTLLKILSGAERRDAGEIRLGGAAFDAHTPRQAREAGISLIHQELALVPQLDAVANIFIGRQTHRHGLPALDRAGMRRRAQEVLERLGLEIDLRQPVSFLPIAQRQGIEIAKALLSRARVLAMDEPTSSLTHRECDRLFAVIRQLRAEGVAIIYVSHRLEELAHVADRATVLRDGQVVGTVPMAEATRERLVTMMVGRDLSQLAPAPLHEPGAEVLRVESLRRGTVLRGVSCRAYRGQVLGLAGLVGAGRTELLRAIFGADPVDAGAIYVDGVRQEYTRPGHAVKLGIGLVPEDRKGQALAPYMSVNAMVSLSSLRRFSRWGFLNRWRRTVAVRDLIDRLSIRPPDAERLVRYLSGGNQQKVVLARWLCAGSRILLLDEPTRGVDVGAKAEIYDLIQRLVAGGMAVVMASSDLPEILQVSDRILVMRQGQVAKELSRGEATEEVIMHYATGGV